ncbi:MAG: IdeS/Mac family cysteine endopeptidase [Phocaeicola sp.]
MGLKWDVRYGWFDCNKRDPNKQQTDSDSEMCWAASSSNLIHWWLEQNKEFVARYSYTGPSAYENW